MLHRLLTLNRTRARGSICARIIDRAWVYDRKKTQGADEVRGWGQLPVPVLAARTKIFNANEHNGIFGGTETEIKITVASWGIARLNGVNPG